MLKAGGELARSYMCIGAFPSAPAPASTAQMVSGTTSATAAQRTMRLALFPSSRARFRSNDIAPRTARTSNAEHTTPADPIASGVQCSRGAMPFDVGRCQGMMLRPLAPR